MTATPPAGRVDGRAIGAVMLATLAFAAAADAHDSAHSAMPQSASSAVKLRECWMTVAYVPRPASVLEGAFPALPDLTETFYGPDPLFGVWAVSCARGQVAGRRVGRVVLSLVGVPMALTAPGAPPLANFLAHALIRADTNSRALAAGLRRTGLPARLRRALRYRHSRRGVVPFKAALELPGAYHLEVNASALDPTNPHEHSNRFTYPAQSGRAPQLGLEAAAAVDRFCFPVAGNCSAFLAAPPESALANLLGDTSAEARVAFDHVKLPRIDLSLRPSPRRSPMTGDAAGSRDRR
jgi:hypothetical protein